MCQASSQPRHRAPVFGCVKFSWIITQSIFKLVPWHWHWNLKIREQVRLCWGSPPPASLKYLPAYSAHPQQENIIFLPFSYYFNDLMSSKPVLRTVQHTFIAQQASVSKRWPGYKTQERKCFFPTLKFLKATTISPFCVAGHYFLWLWCLL